MSELLAAAAAALGAPEAIVKRSAEARAAASGVSVDEVLAAWAGGEAAAAAEAEEPAAPAEPGTEAVETDAEEEAEVTAPAPVPAAAEAAPAPAAVAATVAPVRVTPAEAADQLVVITVPTAGIRERAGFAIPKWLAVVFLFAPVFALLQLGGATEECGEGTELATDVVTGQIVNCDGSPFEGSAVGGGGGDLIAVGEGVYAAGSPPCAGCHGAGGGGGVGPPLGGVVTTFGSCADHIEWVLKGSQGFLGEGRTTYGDPDKPINGGMPGFTGLTEEQLAAVAAFERVRFGGGDPETVLSDCGLVAEAPQEGEDGTTEPTEPGMEAAARDSG